MIADNPKGFLICPCTGEEPFLVDSAQTAYDFVISEEYYAVDLSTWAIALENGEFRRLERKA